MGKREKKALKRQRKQLRLELDAPKGCQLLEFRAKKPETPSWKGLEKGLSSERGIATAKLIGELNNGMKLLGKRLFEMHILRQNDRWALLDDVVEKIAPMIDDKFTKSDVYSVGYCVGLLVGLGIPGEKFSYFNGVLGWTGGDPKTPSAMTRIREISKCFP